MPPAVRVWVRFRGPWWGGREGGALQVDRASDQPPSPREDKLTAQSLSLLRRKGIVTGQTSLKSRTSTLIELMACRGPP